MLFLNNLLFIDLFCLLGDGLLVSNKRLEGLTKYFFVTFLGHMCVLLFEMQIKNMFLKSFEFLILVS